MTLREWLSSMAGVWEGSYLHLARDGAIRDRHESRQRTRLEGERWHEQVSYVWSDGRSRTLDFRAGFDATGERLLYDDPDFHGEAYLLTPSLLVFPYHWKSRPERRIVETLVVSAADRRSRLWQVHEAGKFSGVTVIEEHRVSAETERWW